jgi:pimeloyl-ACP methyl ester carboxylesterase
MLGYGHVLAHAGYPVMLWDFDGHGANPNRLQRYELQKNLDVALKALLEQPEVDRNRLALLGHSMGSGIVMSAGIQNVDRFAATIAVSPTGASVTPQAPHNLQLQAGSWEGGFITNAQRLLSAGGGESSNFTAGTARELVIVPNVEHITILFNDASHQAAVRWLNETFNQTSVSQYRDRRMGWYGLHLLGWLLLLGAVTPTISKWIEPDEMKVSPAKRWVGLLLAPLAGVVGLTLINQQIDLQNLGGVQVGGAIGLWFLIAGGAWLTTLAKVPRLTLRSLGLGLALFAALWIAFGAMAQVVWLQWWLIPNRLLIWLPLSVACLPWFLASGIAQQGIGRGARVAWWFAQTAILMGGFLLTLKFLPQLGFMFLLLPLFPPIIAILSLVVALIDVAWISAIASALFFGWILAAGFPLSG